MDPLTLLRECAVRNRPTRLEGDRVVLGDAPFPRQAETAWRAIKGAFVASATY